MPQEIGARDVAALLRQGKPLTLLDVREPWEREIVSIRGDVHIPMEEIPARAAELPRDGRPIVVYCHAGMRSFAVAGYLEQQGYPSVSSLAGGVDAWASEVDPTLPRY